MTAQFRETAAILKNEGIIGLKNFMSDDKTKILSASYMVRVLDDTGNVLYMKPSIQKKTFDFDAAFRDTIKPETQRGWSSLSAINDEDKFDIFTERSGDGSYVQIGKSSEDREAILGRMIFIFGVTGVGLTFMSAWLGLWYAKKSLAPLRRLVAIIGRIREGNFSERVIESGASDELGDLTKSFNGMLAKIETLLRIMRESLDNVAHDIRTPLTRIRSIAEVALVNEDANLREALADCSEATQHISGLVDQLLSISEAEAGALRLNFHPYPVRNLIEEVIDIYDFVALDKRINFGPIDVDVELVWRLDARRIKQVIANLIDNAIKFSPFDRMILISAEVKESSLKFRVKDQGYGIVSEHLDHIWNRLYRADQSRSSTGSGLGLSIVKAIVQAHGGTVDVAANPDLGMTFSFTIPDSADLAKL